MFCGDIDSGAAFDIAQATELARKMVTDLGISDKLGPRTFGQHQELVFLGREISEQKDFSDETAREIDEEILSIVQRAYAISKRLLTENKEKLKQLAEQLVIHETLSEAEISKMLDKPAPKSATS